MILTSWLIWIELRKIRFFPAVIFQRRLLAKIMTMINHLSWLKVIHKVLALNLRELVGIEKAALNLTLITFKILAQNFFLLGFFLIFMVTWLLLLVEESLLIHGFFPVFPFRENSALWLWIWVPIWFFIGLLVSLIHLRLLFLNFT